MRGGAVSGRESLSRNNKGRGVGSKVLEEVGHAVEEDEGLLARSGRKKLVVTIEEDD